MSIPPPADDEKAADSEKEADDEKAADDEKVADDKKVDVCPHSHSDGTQELG